MNNVQKSIGWADYSVNPVSGYCPLGCSYCYARRMYDRFKWDKTIRYNDSAWCKFPERPSRIFVGSTFELFGDWVMPAWMHCIFDQVQLHPEHTFVFLTKLPQKLAGIKYWPSNAWVGTSVETQEAALVRVPSLYRLSARVRFISFEPLHGRIDLGFSPAYIDLIIIGAETGNRKGKPLLADVQKWAREIIKMADRGGIPVFTKLNLKLPESEQRKEFPRLESEK